MLDLGSMVGFVSCGEVWCFRTSDFACVMLSVHVAMGSNDYYDADRCFRNDCPRFRLGQYTCRHALMYICVLYMHILLCNTHVLSFLSTGHYVTVVEFESVLGDICSVAFGG